MQLSVLPVFLLATTVLADGASILAAVAQITSDTLALNTTVSAWDGGLLSALPIIVESTALLVSINNGTSTASASANLTLAESFSVASKTLALVKDVNATLTTIIAAKPKFEKLLLKPLIWINLELEKDANDKFSTAVIAKVPAALQALADAIIAPVDGYFETAILEYQ